MDSSGNHTGKRFHGFALLSLFCYPGCFNDLVAFDTLVLVIPRGECRFGVGAILSCLGVDFTCFYLFTLSWLGSEFFIFFEHIIDVNTTVYRISFYS